METCITKMNEMFEANAYTDDERVTVGIVDEKTVRVTVLNESININVDELTDYGVMMVIMATVDRLYNGARTIRLSSDYSEYIC